MTGLLATSLQLRRAINSSTKSSINKPDWLIFAAAAEQHQDYPDDEAKRAKANQQADQQ